MSSLATFLTCANMQVDVIKLNWLESRFHQRLSECKAATLSGILFGGTGMYMWVGEWERGNSLTSPHSWLDEIGVQRADLSMVTGQ